MPTASRLRPLVVMHLLYAELSPKHLAVILLYRLDAGAHPRQLVVRKAGHRGLNLLVLFHVLFVDEIVIESLDLWRLNFNDLSQLSFAGRDEVKRVRCVLLVDRASLLARISIFFKFWQQSTLVPFLLLIATVIDRLLCFSTGSATVFRAMGGFSDSLSSSFVKRYSVKPNLLLLH